MVWVGGFGGESGDGIDLTFIVCVGGLGESCFLDCSS